MPISPSTEALRTGGALLAIDTLAITAAVWLAIEGGEWGGASIEANRLALTGALAGICLLFLALCQLYPGVATSAIVEFQRIAVGTTGAFLAFSASAIGLGVASPPWPVLALAWSLALALLLAGRSLGRLLLSRSPHWGVRTIVTGNGEAVKRAYETLRSDPARGLRPVSMVESVEALLRGGSPERCHCVVFATSADAETDPTRVIGALSRRFRRVLVFFTDPLAIDGALWMRASQCGPMFGVEFRNRLLSGWNKLLKRGLDLLVATLTLPALLMVIPITALLVKSTSRGPIFYGSDRIGQGGRRFKAWKFRTMRHDAQAFLADYLDRDPEVRREWKQTKKLAHDPRITPIGRWLRKTSLDELPQLWNVMRGDMSAVGPRPILPDEVPKYDRCLDLYLEVRPGITGLWQISGRNETTYGERLTMVDYYLRNWSLGLDLYILSRTCWVVLTTRGAR
ncbi:MAG: exopolysaccharide biosynthesis polyprenyl glycosylphosphotransferase [Deltaproteobacteria bacterium]|nr:MAG: exopolysaccharide biosynthesis polyprenyl glycosylphosphotransferase [Deltaproteobacteria bacterium]